MNEALQRYVEAATGITSLTKAQAERIVKQLVRQGEAARDQAGDLVEQLLSRSRENREAISALVRSETQRFVRAMGVAGQDEVERLRQQVADLERQLAEQGPSTGGGANEATKKSAKKATKKAAKRSAKKATKKTAKKSTKKATKKTAKKSTKKSSGGSS